VVVKNVTDKISMDVAVTMGEASVVSRVVRRERAKVRGPTPSEPTSLDFDIDLDMCMLDDENTLLFDWMNEEKTKRYTIFTTRELLTRMANAEYWMADGTFSVVSTMYKQLFVIHVPNMAFASVAKPAVFVLMTHKTTMAYEAPIRKIKEEILRMGLELKIKFTICDFEIAISNAFQNVFDGIECRGCNFHLAQSIQRRIQQMGLAPRYNRDQEFSVQIRCFFALCYLSPGLFAREKRFQA
jgi:hypothetical protein